MSGGSVWLTADDVPRFIDRIESRLTGPGELCPNQLTLKIWLPNCSGTKLSESLLRRRGVHSSHDSGG